VLARTRKPLRTHCRLSTSSQHEGPSKKSKKSPNPHAKALRASRVPTATGYRFVFPAESVHGRIPLDSGRFDANPMRRRRIYLYLNDLPAHEANLQEVRLCSAQRQQEN
jgi:hypothetical protein